jgi:hypothetical protein
MEATLMMYAQSTGIPAQCTIEERNPLRVVAAQPCSGRTAPVPEHCIVDDPLQILELVNTASRGKACQIAHHGEQVIDGTLHAAIGHRFTSGSLQLEVRLEDGADAPADWGKAVHVWVPHPTGLLAFTAVIVRVHADRLRLRLPKEVARYLRRDHPRLPVPQEMKLGVAFPLSGGGLAEAMQVVDMSAGGIGVEVAPTIHFDVGYEAPIFLRVSGGLIIRLMVVCAHARTTQRGTRLLGLRFRSIPSEMHGVLIGLLDQIAHGLRA